MSDLIAPRLTTARLLLREARASDFEAYATDNGDPASMPANLKDWRTAWRQFTANAGHWPLTGAGWWMIELTELGLPVGTVGSFFRETQLVRGADAELEIGWTVFLPYRGRGIAKEAARAALDWALDRHSVPRVFAQIDKTNAHSIAVARSLGMESEGDADFYGQPVLRYVARRP